MPKIAPTTPRPAWIVHRLGAQGQPKTPRRRAMKVHRSEASAIAEANRLAALCGASIAVFEQVAIIRPPVVPEPPPAAPPPQPAPTPVAEAPATSKPARSVAVETRRSRRTTLQKDA
ncbi:hypothetical protein [Methylorubrum extorquens]|uniref:Uncharacterized protein n=1 Tax=Methylorubrum extorquens (strain ATCC 14718 / DSM 1338 / JCM 2805 / NCIMB 9133 / AM1) TaxID=272630 RepID=C5B6W3_METEA|nr:hypothetical protein [Methylorubrum extorquens]ACS44195.1 Hypothetical protein MexAM1_p3METAp0021 [Methylorubrum extorquens AM1]MCP1591986.1 hypothetical protein [Methylorubrum extorquens]